MKNFLGIILLIGLISGCGQPVANRDSSGSEIVCFGDSLTEGVGADAGGDYPSVLRKKVSLPVINAGRSGDTTGDALARLERDVLAQNPKIVILTLGANDFLQRVPKAGTIANMGEIIDRIHAKGAMVVWATVKTGFLGDAYSQDFVTLARRKKIILIPDILSGIMFNPEYKYDQLHPNSAGYALMAEKIYQRIKPYL